VAPHDDPYVPFLPSQAGPGRGHADADRSIWSVLGPGLVAPVVVTPVEDRTGWETRYPELSVDNKLKPLLTRRTNCDYLLVRKWPPPPRLPAFWRPFEREPEQAGRGTSVCPDTSRVVPLGRTGRGIATECVRHTWGAFPSSETRLARAVGGPPATPPLGRPAPGLAYNSISSHRARTPTPRTALPVGFSLSVATLPLKLPHNISRWLAPWAAGLEASTLPCGRRGFGVAIATARRARFWGGPRL